jgi:hypothetical protein
LVLVALGAGVWNWTPSIDLEKVDREILELKRPLVQASVEHFLDGGSVGLTLTDAAGKTLECALPVDNQSVPTSWPRVIVGTTWVDPRSLQASSGVREVENPEATKAYLLKLVDEDSCDQNERLLMLAEMRGAPRDMIRVFIRRHLP